MYKATKRKFPLRVVSILVISLLLISVISPVLADQWSNPDAPEYWPEGALSSTESTSGYVQDGDTIYINDTKAYITATPHTTYGGWVYVNITSKTWSGLADIAVGFENTDTRINEVELYNPHTEITDKNITIPLKYLTDPYKTNYTYSSSHGNDVYNGTIYVWGNVTTYPLDDPEGALYGSEPTGWVWQLFYQHYFEELDRITYQFFWTEYNEIVWESVVDRLSWVVKDKEAFGMNRWYLSNFNVQNGTEYYFRFHMYTKPSLEKSLSKYTIALKPAAETIEEAFANEHIYVLDPWLAGGWDQRVKVTIDSGDIDTANLTNFPVLLYLSTSSGYNSEDITFIFDEIAADANRKKIAVTISDGETECFVEIEKWSQATEKAWLWVKVPNVAFASNTDLYLYYDADHADNTDYVDDTNTGNSTNVWDSNFVTVHHKDGTQDVEVDDSTDQDNDVVSDGGTPDYDSTGIMGSDCVGYVEASSEYLQITDAPELDGFGTFACWESWIYVTDHTAVNIHPIFTKWGAEDAYYIWQNWADPDNNIYIYYSEDGAVLDYNWADMNALTDATWYHLAVVWEDSVVPKFYLNGVLLTTQRTDTTTGIFGANTNLQLAGYTVGGTYWDGRLDEMRISNAERKAEWMAATYETGIDELLDWGTEESGATDTYTWTFLSTTTTTSATTSSTATDTDTTTTSTADITTSTDLTTSTGAAGGFPIIEDITETTPQSATTHVIDYPVTVDPDDLLIVTFACDDDEATLTCADFTQIYKEDAGAQGPTLYVGWRKAIGNEDGTTFNIVTGTTEGSCAYVFRITGAEDPDTQPPEVSLEGTGSSVNPNSLSLTPTGGSKNYLFISAEGNDDDDDTTGWPSNMADNNIFSQQTTVTLGIATEEVAAAVFDPAQFTIAASESWEAVTIGVHPTAPPVTTITSVTTTSTTSCETILSTEFSSSSVTSTVVYIWTVVQIIIDPLTTVTTTSACATTTTVEGTTTTVSEGTTCTTEAVTTTTSFTSVSSTTTCTSSTDLSTSSTTTCDTTVQSSTSSTTTCDTTVVSSTETTTICDTSIVSSTETTTICDTSTETETITETETETETVCETTSLTSEIVETTCVTQTLTHTTECQTICETSIETSETTSTTCETSVLTSETTTTICDTSIESSTSSTTTCDTTVQSSTSSTTTCDTSIDSSTSSTTTCDTDTDTSTYSSTSSTTTCDTSVDSSTSSTTTCTTDTDTSTYSSTSSTTTCDTSVYSSTSSTTTCDTSVMSSTSTSCKTTTVTHVTSTSTTCETETETECTTTCETTVITSVSSTTTCTTDTDTSVYSSTSSTTTCDTTIKSSTSSTTTCDTDTDTSTYSSTSSTTTCDTLVYSSTSTTTTCDTSVYSSTSSTTTCTTSVATSTICETSYLTSEITETSCATITVTHTTETETVCETSTSTSETTTTTCDTSIYSSTSSTTTCDTETATSTYSSTSSTTTCDTSIYSSTSSTTTCATETATSTYCSTSSTTTCDTSVYSSTSSTTTCDTDTDSSTYSSTSSTTICETLTETETETECETTTVTHTTECSTTCETLTETETETECETSTSTSISSTTTCTSLTDSSISSTTTCTSSTDSSVSSTTTCTSLTDTSISSTTTCSTSTSISSTTTCETLTSIATTCTTTCDTDTDVVQKTKCVTVTQTHTTSTSTSCETLTSITTTSTTTSSTITSTFTSESTSLTTTSTCTSTSTSSCTTTTLMTTITSGTQTTTTAVDTVVYDGCVLDEFDNDDLVALYNNTERDAGGWVQVVDIPSTHVPTGILNITGIHDSGNLGSVQARDANTYNLSEVGGAPGFSIIVNFSLDHDFTGLDVHLLYTYDGPGGHIIEVQVWNFTSGAWVDTPNNPTIVVPLTWCNNSNVGDYRHLRGPGPDTNVSIRIHHSSPGNVNDDFAIDYIEITSDVCVCGYVWSENMLASLNVTSIVNFRYNITIPVFSGAYAKIQFSQDNATWVDSGGINQWEDMSTGDNSILLTGLGWSGNFYYRTHMNKDLNGTSPELDLVQVCYSTTAAGGGNGNFIIVIAVILSALAIPIMLKRRR